MKRLIAVSSRHGGTREQPESNLTVGGVRRRGSVATYAADLDIRDVTDVVT
jgi:hypothetical protein